MLRCVEHGHRFTVRNAVADLLRPKYAEVLERLKDKPTRRANDEATATAWLLDTLAMESRIPPTGSSDRILKRLLSQVAALLALAREMRLDADDVREVYAILAGEAMAAGYWRHVADPARASMEAVNYEKYEDILLRKVMSSALAQSDAVALLELGSGPGRLLHQYGSTISSRRDACQVYRRLGPKLYRPSSLPDHDRLRLVLGVDFADDMLQSASKWLVQDKLGDLIVEGRIAQVRATVRDLPFAFSSPEWDGTTRVACILFQTLGNQLSRDLQVEMLRAANLCIGERGVVFVSVFNAQSFDEQGRQYYESIEGSVGPAWAFDDRSFLSKFGVYSRWLFPEELRDLMADADMGDASVLTGETLRLFPEYESYIDVARQDRYKRRALIGVYARGLDVEVV